jgi:hypothetical protein
MLLIRSFKHRGLKRLYERGDRSGIGRDLLEKVERILTLLDSAATPKLLMFPCIGYTGSRAIWKDCGPSLFGPTGASFSALKERTPLTLN